MYLHFGARRDEPPRRYQPVLWPRSTLIYTSVFYPYAEAAPVLTWFVRFGLGVTLMLAGGAMFGDLVEREKFSFTSGVLASVISLAGALIGLFQAMAD